MAFGNEPLLPTTLTEFSLTNKFHRRSQYLLTNQRRRMKYKLKGIKESQWILHDDKKVNANSTIDRKDEIALLEDEFCQDYDNLQGTPDTGLRIVETISIPKTPKNLSMKLKGNTKRKIPTALLNTNKNLVKTNEILLSIVKMIKMTLKTNNAETPDKVTKKDLENKLEQQKQEHSLFVQNIADILKANEEKEKHMQNKINSLKIENEEMKKSIKSFSTYWDHRKLIIKANQQKTVQNTDLSNQSYHKQTARKSTIYKDLRCTK